MTDLDLCRRIVMERSALDAKQPWSADAITSHDNDMVWEQCLQLRDDGLIVVDEQQRHVVALTSAGREFLRLSRNDTLWARVKSEFATSPEPVTLTMVRARLLEWAQFSF